jgi:23S rRNA pseudouridine1911/1915/1917 synthase
MMMNAPAGMQEEQKHLFTVTPEAAGQRVDQYVQRSLGGDISRAQVQRLLSDGMITINRAPARPAQRLQAGWVVQVRQPSPEPLELVPEPMDLDIIFEDADLIAINKPPGLVVHPAAGHHTGTLVHGLLHHCLDLAGIGGRLRPGIVHRLDMDTSGVLLVAKSDLAHRRLVAFFASGRVEKRYLTLVHGRPPKRGESQSPIGRHPKDRKRMAGDAPRGKPAHTAWRVVEHLPQQVSLLRVAIATGRTHQIRVHMAEAGYPVLGDRVYGGRRFRRGLEAGPGRALKAANRQMLHAVRLSLVHPISRETLDLWAPLPADFRAVLAALREPADA